MYWLVKLCDPDFLAADNAIAMVVRAVDEPTARSVAAERAGDEGVAIWYDPQRSTCVNLNDLPPSTTLVLRDLHNG
jgi:hypothetical protein